MRLYELIIHIPNTQRAAAAEKIVPLRCLLTLAFEHEAQRVADELEWVIFVGFFKCNTRREKEFAAFTKRCSRKLCIEIQAKYYEYSVVNHNEIVFFLYIFKKKENKKRRRKRRLKISGQRN